MDTRAVAKGLYTVELWNADVLLQTEKLIVQ